MTEFQKKILIVDDEEMILSVFDKVLRGAGYSTHLAKNGLEALEAIKCNNFNLVFLDVLMPILNGVETLEKLKKIENDLPVIVMTGFSDKNLLSKMEKIGFKCLLNKPFGVNDIIDCARQYAR